MASPTPSRLTTAWRSAFADRVVLVTGASSGIGRATAAAFAAAGARVALVARRRPELEQFAAEIASSGGRALVAPADVTDRAQVAACFDAVTAELGPIDVVVNNAGVLRPAHLADVTAADLQAMLQVNLFGALYVMQEALARMRPQEAGTIVNVGSLAGRRGVAPLGGYCATKFALVGLTEAVRTELDGNGVHLALVLPGVVETPMVEAVDHDPDFVDVWPPALNMPPSWVVWAIFAAVRFRLVEVAVPPGAALLEKLAALAPGAGDALVRWARSASRWVADATRGGER